MCTGKANYFMKTRTRKQAGALTVVLAMAGAALIPTAAHAAPIVNDDPITFETGHIDAFNPVLNDDGSILLALKEDVTGSHVLRDPAAVELYVKDAALRSVPDGYLPGMPSEIYHLPLTQDGNLIWPGWDTQALTSEFPEANTDIVVSEIDGPGQVFLWSQNSFGAAVSLLEGGEGYELPGTISQPYPAHTHANWGFTAPGTYKFVVRADVTGSNGASASSNTATYTFVIGARTALTPEAPVQNGNTVTVPDQPWVTYTDADGAPIAAGELELSADLDIEAHVAYGFDLAEDATSSWSFTYEEPAAEQALEITGLLAHYHQNGQIVLTAEATPEVDGAVFEWALQRKDQSEPQVIADQTGSELRVTAEQALNDASVTVRLLDADGAELASAEAVVIEVDDHGAAPLQTVTVSGAKEHYHSGDVATLTASVAPASVLTRYTWQVRQAGETGWETIAGENAAEYSFEVGEGLEDAEVRAVLTYNDGEAYVSSEPVVIEIDDHHGEEPVETTLSIDGLKDHYHTGGVATLTAVQNPQTDEDHYHWFIKRAGDTDFSVISGALTDTLEYTIAEGDADAQIIARLYDHDHNALAESEPVTLTVNDHHGEEPAEKPDSAPVNPGEDGLGETPAGGIELDKSTVAQGGEVTIQADEHADEWAAAWLFSEPVLLGDDWQQIAADGSLTVTIPADATVGAHRLALYDASNTLIGWQNLEITAAVGSGSAGGSDAAIAVTGASGAQTMLLTGALALLVLGAGAAFVARRRSAAASSQE